MQSLEFQVLQNFVDQTFAQLLGTTMSWNLSLFVSTSYSDMATATLMSFKRTFLFCQKTSKFRIVQAQHSRFCGRIGSIALSSSVQLLTQLSCSALSWTLSWKANHKIVQYTILSTQTLTLNPILFGLIPVDALSTAAALQVQVHVPDPSRPCGAA
jgi:hypothetical protein